MQIKFFMGLIALSLAFCLLVSACHKDTETTGTQGAFYLEITDAPIDDANVKGVFVTVVDVQIDGKSWAGFSGKTTLDLMAYQNGKTKVLGNGTLDAKSYNEIKLVLDNDTDAAGNSPGCYVLTAQNQKSKLDAAVQKTIDISGNFDTKKDETQSVVIDFDLRKSIQYKSTNADAGYSFVTDAELQAALRLQQKSKAGTVKGKCADTFSGSEKIVVYAYKKGTYNAGTEHKPQGASQIRFKNAINSSTVASDGSFKLAFLDEGDYEMHFISYEDTDNDGKLEAKGELELSLTNNIGLNLLGISLDAGAELDLNLLVIGRIDF